MKKLIIKKLIGAAIVVASLTIIIFLLIHLMPGDPVLTILGMEATPEQYDILKHKLGLDKPLLQQYTDWVLNMLRGDWGKSLINDSPVLPMILERLPRTMMLCIPALILSLLIAVPLGVISAAKHNTFTDLSVSSGSLLMLSIPEFYFGMLLLILFAVILKWLPASGYTPPSEDFGMFLKRMILPICTLGICLTPPSIRLIRGSMLDVLHEDYVMLARTKGNSPPRVNFVHALRNSLIPISTSICMRIARLMAGSIIVEKVFQYPGMGMLLVRSIQRRDYTVIQGCLFAFSLIIVFVNFMLDFIYAAIDPRIRLD